MTDKTMSILEHIIFYGICTNFLFKNQTSFMLNGVSSLVVCHQSALLIWQKDNRKLAENLNNQSHHSVLFD